jgi:hypothetical protein
MDVPSFIFFFMLHNASKKFGKWYQEKEKKEDTNKLTILAFKIILILHNTLLATFIKASGKCQERPSLGVDSRTLQKRPRSKI